MTTTSTIRCPAALATVGLLAGGGGVGRRFRMTRGREDGDNAADLNPADTVRFNRGGVWRGSLVPASGDKRGPVTYTAYGQGPKPLILGSRPRHRPEDWVYVEGNICATLPLHYTAGAPVASPSCTVRPTASAAATRTTSSSVSFQQIVCSNAISQQ